MRGWQALPLLILLAGCVGGDGADAPAPSTPTATTAEGREAGAVDGSVAPPPVHPVGRAWTFTGVQHYNPDTEIVVVVAEASESGYLFAGGAEDDLVYEALWMNPLYGPRTRDLAREGSTRKPLDFPLEDGKSWAYTDTLTLTATRATVQTPLGSEEGFLIAGANERVSVEWGYAPSLGQLTHIKAVFADGTVLDDLRLSRVEEARPWVWYELGPLTVVGGSQDPKAFQVDAGWDHVIASVGGTAGARAFVQPPGASAWTAEFTDREVWVHAMLPATEGAWAAGVAGRPFLDGAPEVEWPVGWGYMHVAPVRWVRGG